MCRTVNYKFIDTNFLTKSVSQSLNVSKFLNFFIVLLLVIQILCSRKHTYTHNYNFLRVTEFCNSFQLPTLYRDSKSCRWGSNFNDTFYWIQFFSRAVLGRRLVSDLTLEAHTSTLLLGQVTIHVANPFLTQKKRKVGPQCLKHDMSAAGIKLEIFTWKFQTVPLTCCL